MTREEALREIDELFISFHEECEGIAEDCAEEGYPDHGSNYELRKQSLWDSYYKEPYEALYDIAGGMA